MSIHIVNCGTQSPVGTWTSMSAANIRAGLARVRVYPDYLDSQWSPIKVATADYLEPGLPNTSRFLKLGLDALKETFVPVKEIDPQPAPIPLLIGLPEERDGLQTELEAKFKEQLIYLENNHDIRFHVEFFRSDHTAGMIAIKEAMHRLQERGAEVCIAGGMESYISSSTLSWLEKQGRLQCSYNKWGMVPGEAAGFCLLTTSEIANKHQLPILAEIKAVADAKEKTKPGDVCLGKALTQSIGEVLTHLPERETVHQVFCDLNSQRDRADEYGYSMLKLNRHFDAPLNFIAPANLWGDLGAASASLLISLATESSRKGYAKGPNNLIFTMSPGGSRAAALIRLNKP